MNMANSHSDHEEALAGNFNMEENNNMDENSNDQAYEQYPNYHRQHFLAQQEHLRQNDSIEQRIEPSNSNINQYVILQRPNQFSAENLSSASSFNAASTSVRPRVPVDRNVRRRTSCNFVDTDSRTLETNRNQQEELLNSQDETDDYKLNVHFNWSGPESSSISSRTSSTRNEYCAVRRGQINCHSTDLPPLPRPIVQNENLVVMPHTTNQTEREAEDLLYYFTQDELRRSHVPVPEDIASHPGLDHSAILRAGSELRRLADAFAATPARAKVRGMAEEVLFSTLTWENFSSLCMTLFAGPQGITSERIVALFTFIADVAKLEIKRGAQNCVRQLMAWSLRFIFEKICQWVQQAGGWGRVLSHGLDTIYKLAVSAAALAAAFALSVYAFKALRQS